MIRRNTTKAFFVFLLFFFCLSHPAWAQDVTIGITGSDSQKQIEFDPNKGIVIEEPGLDPSKKQEDYLLDRVDGTTGTMAEVDTSRPYIDRQIEKQFYAIRNYLGEIWLSYKKVFSWLLAQLIKVLAFVKQWPIVESPPPPFLSIPLIGLLHFLVSYPLMKIARMITNDDWMAWVPGLQLVLLLKMTERSQWTLIVFLIPIANLLLLVIIFKELAEIFRQPPWYCLLILVPGVNIALLWYLANVEFDS